MTSSPASATGDLFAISRRAVAVAWMPGSSTMLIVTVTLPCSKAPSTVVRAMAPVVRPGSRNRGIDWVVWPSSPVRPAETGPVVPVILAVKTPSVLPLFLTMSMNMPGISSENTRLSGSNQAFTPFVGWMASEAVTTSDTAALPWDTAIAIRSRVPW